jgi:hypothetical protein
MQDKNHIIRKLIVVFKCTENSRPFFISIRIFLIWIIFTLIVLFLRIGWQLLALLISRGLFAVFLLTFELEDPLIFEPQF